MAAPNQPTVPGLARDGCLGLLQGIQGPVDPVGWRSSLRSWASGTSKLLHRTAWRHWALCLGQPLKALPLVPGVLCLPACRPLQPLHANLDHGGGASEANSSSWTWEPGAQGHHLAVQPECSERRPLPQSQVQQLLSLCVNKKAAR